MTFNAMASVIEALRTWPEPVSLPDSLVDSSPMELAEARSRLQQISQVARELVKVIDGELAEALQGSALNYGGQIIRASNGGGSAKVRDEGDWWHEVVTGLKDSPNPEGLLAALYPASSVRLTALPKLEAALGLDDGKLKQVYIVYDPPTSLLSVMPISKAPKYLHDLAEGEIR